MDDVCLLKRKKKSATCILATLLFLKIFFTNYWRGFIFVSIKNQNREVFLLEPGDPLSVSPLRHASRPMQYSTRQGRLDVDVVLLRKDGG